MADPEFNIWPAVVMGDTTDVYFQRTASVLRNESINPIVVMEFFPHRPGILCGVKESLQLLERVLPKNISEVWALLEGDEVAAKEVALRVKAPYSSFGIYETAVCGILSQCTAWATAARECVEAAGEVPVSSFGARHVHPNVTHILDYSAVVGGCSSCSSALGAKLADVTPAGTMPHAYIIVVGDLVKATHLFDKHMPPEVPRVALVDTFKDEVEESLRVAGAMQDKLRAVRLDTPVERGGVTPELVQEVRAHLDMHSFKQVGIIVTGGLTPDRIRQFVESGATIDSFGVGSYIAGAPPNDFTGDIHEVDGRPIAKRGRIPGVTNNPRLTQVL
jgi:nicotinate phosphoribosyltransferase